MLRRSRSSAAKKANPVVSSTSATKAVIPRTGTESKGGGRTKKPPSTRTARRTSASPTGMPTTRLPKTAVTPSTAVPTSMSLLPVPTVDRMANSRVRSMTRKAPSTATPSAAIRAAKAESIALSPARFSAMRLRWVARTRSWAVVTVKADAGNCCRRTAAAPLRKFQDGAAQGRTRVPEPKAVSTRST